MSKVSGSKLETQSDANLPMRHVLRSLLLKPVSARPLALFRIVFGLVMFVEVCRYFYHGRVAYQFITPLIHFHYDFFEWLRPLNPTGMYMLWGTMGVLALCITIGFMYRYAAVWFFILFSYQFLLDQTYYKNHFYLICLVSFLLIFVDADKHWSIAKNKAATVPAWMQYVLMLQIGLVYFLAAIAKIYPDWLQGYPMKLWIPEKMPWLLNYLPLEFVAYAFSYAGIVIDLFAFPLLLFRRTRVWILLALAGFHLTNHFIFDIGIFPWLMFGLTIVLFTDLFKEKELPLATTPAYSFPKAIMALLVAVFFLQLLLPFRHILISGDRYWTEEGQKFSWQMMMRRKQGHADFYLYDKETQQQEKIDYSLYITSLQAKVMCRTPEMLQRFAVQLRKLKEKEGHKNFEIRVKSFAALNGRKFQLMIDSTVDLSIVPRPIFGHSAWIIPLTTVLETKSEK